MYRFRTRCGAVELRFAGVSWVGVPRQNPACHPDLLVYARGSGLFAFSIC